LAESLLKPEYVEVVKRPWPADDQPFKWDASPIELRVKAKRIPAWKKDYLGLVGVLRQSPVKSGQPLEKVTLIPMGCARLRISSFPTVGGEGSNEWSAPKEPLAASASAVFERDTVTALSDGLLPSGSDDHSIPRFTWWEHKGTLEWVQYELPKFMTLSKAAVYWFDDTGIGECRVPASWRLLYLDGDEWREVPNPSAYRVEKDCFNEVSFGSIKTRRIRVEVQLREGFSGGILEWRVK
jgi:hypothetical protein